MNPYPFTTSVGMSASPRIWRNSPLSEAARWIGRGRDVSSTNTTRVELHGIEGYTVFFADGRRLGVVAWLEYGSRSDEPDAVIVRRRFYERPRLVRLPTAMLAAVERNDRTVGLAVPHNPNLFSRQSAE